MIAFVALLAMWPFHHKAPIESPCVKQGDLYFYAAEDGTIAFSHAGCDAAISNTRVARLLNQFKMSKL